MAARQRDIAKMASVSTSTVSRALHGDTRRPVALDTRQRILDAALRLNYEPSDGARRRDHERNDAAQRLVQRVDRHVQRTGGVGLILGQAGKFSDPFWSRVLDGIAEELIRQTYHLRFALTISDLERRSQKVLLDVDGLIVLGGVRPIGEGSWPRRTVMIEGADDQGRWHETLPADIITPEKRRAMYRLIDHLVALGHRNLAFLGPSVQTDERAESFIQALHHHGLPFDPSLFLECDWTAEAGYEAAKGLLGAGRLPDVLVCGNDSIAVGAMRAAKQHGLRLPAELGITGFDDILFARDLDPPLTTIHVPKELLGELAVRSLVERTGQLDRAPILQVVPTSLIVRRSCGAQYGEGSNQLE
jgi:DNA-binding LacI/PurR family transcriptional regulator